MPGAAVTKARKASSTLLAGAEQGEKRIMVAGVDYNYRIRLSNELSKYEKLAVWKIFGENMKVFYVGSSFGWHPIKKKKELFHVDSRFILLNSQANDGDATTEMSPSETMVAFSMFRFEMEETMEDDIEEEVLYCYELQVSSHIRRSGLGRYLISDMENIGRKWKMSKVMLTVLNDNEEAITFYQRMGFEMDPISPSRVMETQTSNEQDLDNEESSEPGEQIDYEIYSKVITDI